MVRRRQTELIVTTSATSTAPVKLTSAGSGGVNVQSLFSNNRITLGTLASTADSLGYFGSVYTGADGQLTNRVRPRHVSGSLNSGYDGPGPAVQFLQGIVNTGAVTLTMAGLTAGINQGGQPATIPSWAAGTSYTQGTLSRTPT